ncbi:aminoglycoside phosphotransferase family protein [Streptomyces sp. B6B3]|uniref:phosphotransferase family protein n=1 Tax=Streptomyces sp. B6B3 TaxID=3153570 RepID=UPI00325C5D60
MRRNPDDRAWEGTRAWVEEVLGDGARVDAVVRLMGGWTSEMRRLRVSGVGDADAFVLRSFVRPFFVRHAEALLLREAATLRLLSGTGVPAPVLYGVDAAGDHCDHPSLLMSRLPGSVRLETEGHEPRTARLARQLVGIHRLRLPVRDRPRDYQAWTTPERVRIPEATDRPVVWRRAVDLIRRDPPSCRGTFLHRDFHPGNVLFTGQGTDLVVSGVVDWVETSWGPSDLDVAHCSTALALLHGVPAGMRMAEEYVAAGGTLSPNPADHLYWRLLDALAFAPDAEKVAVPWRELGRTDLTPAVLERRLESYLAELLRRYGDG